MNTEENNFHDIFKAKNEGETILNSIHDPSNTSKEDKILTLDKENKKLTETNNKLNKLKIKNENKIDVTISISVILAVVLMVSMCFIFYLRCHTKDKKEN